MTSNAFFHEFFTTLNASNKHILESTPTTKFTVDYFMKIPKGISDGNYFLSLYILKFPGLVPFGRQFKKCSCSS